MNPLKASRDHILLVMFFVIGLPHLVCSNEQKTPTESVKTMVSLIRHHQYDEALSIVDVDELGKYCLSKHWDEESTANKDQFIKLLRDLLIHVAFKKSTNFFNDLEISYQEENIRADNAEVLTYVEHPDEGEIEIEYRLNFYENEWRIYDVLLDGASLASNLRGQMIKMIEEKSFNELISKMDEKLQENISKPR